MRQWTCLCSKGRNWCLGGFWGRLGREEVAGSTFYGEILEEIILDFSTKRKDSGDFFEIFSKFSPTIFRWIDSSRSVQNKRLNFLPLRQSTYLCLKRRKWSVRRFWGQIGLVEVALSTLPLSNILEERYKWSWDGPECMQSLAGCCNLGFPEVPTACFIRKVSL